MLRVVQRFQAEEDSIVAPADDRDAEQKVRAIAGDGFGLWALRDLLSKDATSRHLLGMKEDEVVTRVAGGVKEGKYVFVRKGGVQTALPAPLPPPQAAPPPKKEAEKKVTQKKPWKLDVTVFTKPEWTWPATAVTVEVKGPSGSTKSVAMTSNRSGPVSFTGNHDAASEYEVTATPPAGWKVVVPVKVVLRNDDEKVCEVELAGEPSHVWFQCLYAEPEGTARALPKGLPVVVEFADASTKKLSLGDKGGLDFEIEPRKTAQQKALEWFTLKFEPGDQRFVVNDPKKPDQDDLLQTKADADTSGKDGAKRAFSLPKAFALKESDWKVEPPEHFADNKFKDAKDPAVAFGKSDAPVKLTLDPHWQHCRFVHASRWRPKEAARISIPRTFVDAFEDKAKEGPDAPIRSNWTTGAAADGRTAVQCVPWIARDAAKPKPDDKVLLRFETAADTFVETKDDGSRAVASGVKHDKAEAERLRFYDLPKVWRSHQYYARLSGGTGVAEEDLFEKLAAKATAVDRALTFCLDDIVLCKDDLTPLVWTSGDRVALFSHLFDKKDLDGTAVADLSAEGIHKPDDTNHLSFFSEKQSARAEDDRNYFFRYADWTRLVAYNGNLFEVFDRRVNQESPDLAKVTGARAGVRWVDATEAFAGIKAWTWNAAGAAWAAAADDKPQPQRMLGDASKQEKRPPRTDKPFFSIQPYCLQRTSVRYRERFVEGHDEGGGRFDMVLLRCCDVVDVGKPTLRERGVNLHYFKFAFNFIDDPAVAPVGTVASPLPANLPPVAPRPKWENEIIRNVNNRWNGEDAVNSKRALLLPQGAAVKVEVPVVWIGQNLATALSHFLVDVKTFTSDARDNRGGMLGTGESTTMSHADRTSNDWFPSAHETGHADSLPDEYNERWDSCSYSAISYNSNIVADPYEPDGRTPAGQVAASPMMNGNQTMRNRYFWHCAEWVRRAVSAAGTAEKFKVSYDTYANYLLPPHPTDGRTFAFWPAAHSLAPDGAAAVGRSAANSCDVFLNILGEEKWTVTDLPAADQPSGGVKANKTYDGVLTVVIKLSCRMADATWAGPPTAKQISDWNTAAAQALEAAVGVLNNRWYVTGDVGAGEQAKTFTRCLIQFSARFLVLNHPDGPKATGIENVHKRHYELRWLNDGRNFACWGTPAGDAELMSAGDWTTLATGAALNKPGLDALVTAYHLIAKQKLAARRDALANLIAQAGTVAAEPAIAAAPAKLAAVTTLVTSASAARQYCADAIPSRLFFVLTTTFAVLRARLEEYLPNFLAIEKPPGEIVAADLDAIVARAGINNAQVHRI